MVATCEAQNGRTLWNENWVQDVLTGGHKCELTGGPKRGDTIWIQGKMSVQIQTSTLELHREDATASAHHRPQVCAVDEHVPHEQSIRAVGDHLLRCNPLVCAVGDHVLHESKKEQVKEPPEPTQQ